MPKFKKSSGFKMGGYSYPGTSPVMKNGKDAVIEAAAGTAPNMKVKTTESEAKGYDRDKGRFQALLKATQENPEPKSYSEKHMEEHKKSLNDRARQIQVLDYTKKSLTPAKMYGKKSPNKFNAGLKKASAEGKLDENPKFKAAVDASPAKKYKSAAQRKAVHASKNEKASPAKNYKNPQDYKVFNMGNKPTPVKMHGKKKKY